MSKKKVLVIIGSTRANSSNLKLMKNFEEFSSEHLTLTFFESLSELPHFNPDLDHQQPPLEIIEFRKQIISTDAVIICTPEYVFSLPGSLKNAIEWCVSTTIFSQLPVGLITASAMGEKAHEELKLIMKTVEAKFKTETTLLIKGISGKFDENGKLNNQETINKLKEFSDAFIENLG